MASSVNKKESDPVSGQVQQVTPYHRWLTNVVLRSEMESEGADGSAISQLVLGNMLEADTLEAAFAAQDNSAPSGKDMVGIDIRVTDFTFAKSDTTQYGDKGLPIYLRINALNLFDGTQIQFCCGAPNIVMLLDKADQLNALPLDCRIESKAVANGELLTLRRLPKRAI